MLYHRYMDHNQGQVPWQGVALDFFALFWCSILLISFFSLFSFLVWVGFFVLVFDIHRVRT